MEHIGPPWAGLGLLRNEKLIKKSSGLAPDCSTAKNTGPHPKLLKKGQLILVEEEGKNQSWMTLCAHSLILSAPVGSVKLFKILQVFPRLERLGIDSSPPASLASLSKHLWMPKPKPLASPLPDQSSYQSVLCWSPCSIFKPKHKNLSGFAVPVPPLHEIT